MGSDVVSIKVRDEFLGWTKENKLDDVLEKLLLALENEKAVRSISLTDEESDSTTSSSVFGSVKKIRRAKDTNVGAIIQRLYLSCFSLTLK